jgi:hypothetical protein
VAALFFSLHAVTGLKKNHMKRRLLALLITCLIAGCDDNDDKKDQDSKINQIQTTAVSGQWRVINFSDNGDDHTQKFNGFLFQFDSGNNITATNGASNYPGVWSVAKDDGTDDHSKQNFDDIDFNISFSSPPDFEMLSEEWEIISLTGGKIELRHVSGGNGGTRALTFEKIS